MKLTSSVKLLGTVQFPAHTGERIYMREFRKSVGLPVDLARWQPTVDAMLESVDTDGPIFLMVDQGLVRAGLPQRRPGLHIDGYWDNGVRAHGPVQPGHIFAAAHRPETFEPKHRARSIPSTPVPTGRHQTTPTHSGWDTADFTYPEDILLASNLAASRVLLGAWEGQIGAGGRLRAHRHRESDRATPRGGSGLRRQRHPAARVAAGTGRLPAHPRSS